MLARQGMDKPHGYGANAIWASPNITAQQKSNLAAATGVMHKGSSRTLAIEWIYGPEGQPEVRNPILAIRAWGLVAIRRRDRHSRSRPRKRMGHAVF